MIHGWYAYVICGGETRSHCDICASLSKLSLTGMQFCLVVLMLCVKCVTSKSEQMAGGLESVTSSLQEDVSVSDPSGG